MKKTKLALLMGFTLFSFSSNAIENGNNVILSDAPSIVEMNCTGSIIAGKWVLTAAHCAWESAGGLRPVTAFNGTRYETLKQIDHPLLNTDGIDVGLWELKNNIPMDNVTYLSDLDKENVKINEKLKIYGFGGTNGKLNYAIQNVKSIQNQKINLSEIGQGIQIEGDSGGPNVNSKNEIVAVTSGGDGTYTGGLSISLHKARNFILDNVDSWHFPTIAKTTNGTVTIKVQSLHKDIVSDTAYTDGDVTITGGTCLGSSSINPFDTCTYVVASNGGEGKLILSNNNYIIINKTETPNPKPDPKPDNGSEGGGSLGWMGLLALLSIATRRKS